MRWPDGDPNDGLTIVHTDILSSIEQQFRDLREKCAEAARYARMAEGPGLDAHAIHALNDAIAACEHAGTGLDDIADAVGSARDALDASERAVQAIVSSLSSQVAALLGFFGAPLALLGGLALAGPALGLAARIAQQPAPVREHFAALARAGLDQLTRTAGTPGAVAATGFFADNIGTFLLGAFRVPPGLAALLGEGGLRLATLDRLALDATMVAAAAGVSGVAGVRVAAQPLPASGGAESRQVPLSSAVATTQPVTAPVTSADRGARVPDGSSGQIRIEKYASDRGPYVEVYIAGTDMGAPTGGTNPWDNASNAALVAGENASSLQAVDLALIDAGVTPETPVFFTGHSQGALIAAMAAESGRWNAAGLLAIGGPLGGVPITGDYPALVVEHSDDPVTRLAGEHDLDTTTATIVQSRAFSDGAPDAFAAHHLDRYIPTLATLDATDDWALRHTADRFPNAVAEGTVTVYRAERLGDDQCEAGEAKAWR